ncbi:hypothetical protein [Rhizobium ruizarguesonis]|uniref:hypothetical protein n=1 Tax=Rhizobium ruizarguesonis TaxID=2081791 RepID=UPI00102FA5EC|nr:hypothetical protein [Rhizobium ruizarguesonis]TAV00315.1 hypothetical protein ELI39_30920 [Rhizobium ruizarguesonis]
MGGNRRAMGYLSRVAFATAAFALNFSPSLSENCKSVRADILPQFKEEIGHQVYKVNISKMEELESITIRGAQGDKPGYKCLGTAVVWESISSEPHIVNFIYTVFDLEMMQNGATVHSTMIGISWLCDGTRGTGASVTQGCPKQ